MPAPPVGLSESLSTNDTSNMVTSAVEPVTTSASPEGTVYGMYQSILEYIHLNTASASIIIACATIIGGSVILEYIYRKKK